MVLKIQKNININQLRDDLKHEIDNGLRRNDYSIEINLIYKIIHKYSNYEDHMWTLSGLDKKTYCQNINSLLVEISKLDPSLAWDCIDVYCRYENKYNQRHKTYNQYFRSN